MDATPAARRWTRWRYAGTRIGPAQPQRRQGRLPDRDGIVTLDASIMDEAGNCGGVAAIERIAHPHQRGARGDGENPARAAGRCRCHPIRARTGFHRREPAHARGRAGPATAQDASVTRRASTARCTTTASCSAAPTTTTPSACSPSMRQAACTAPPVAAWRGSCTAGSVI